jgi:hypothetical protein
MSRKNMIKEAKEFPWEILLSKDGKTARYYIDTHLREDVEKRDDIFNLSLFIY